VDKGAGQEVLKAISPLGVEASIKAIAALKGGDVAQRATLSNKLEQLKYEAARAFEQYDAADARNRLVAAELERRWNEKLQEIESTQQRLSSLEMNRSTLSSEEEERIRWMGENFAEVWQSDRSLPPLKKDDFSSGNRRDRRSHRHGQKDSGTDDSLERRYSHSAHDRES